MSLRIATRINTRITTRITTLAIALSMPLCAMAQLDEPLPAPEGQEQPEEVVVVGQRQIIQLRLQMLDAEKLAYDTFNQFNDERRFNISCSTQVSANSHIQSDEQMCQPEFELQAMRAAGQDYLNSYRNFLDPTSADKGDSSQSVPAAALIASQQVDYRRKMREVAEEHPEFLEALIEYTEVRQRYEAASGAASKGSK